MRGRATVRQSERLVTQSATHGLSEKETKEISMPQKPLPANKIRQLLNFSGDDYFNKTETAKGLRIARNSATKYIKAFQNSTLTLTDIENVGSAQHAELRVP